MLSYHNLQKIGRQLGIHKLGVAQAADLESDRLNNWLNRGYQGQMTYLERNLEKRLSPDKLLNGAQSIVSIFVNYHQDEKRAALDGVISKYAWGRDYHIVLRDLLQQLAEKLHGPAVKELTRREGLKVYRVFVDSAPVMEKQWATIAGIGWQGKHSNIITREFGSWGFLGEIITTEKFDQYDLPIPDYCGSCTACIDACPTDAIVEPYVVDGSKCISYATIELPPEEPIPAHLQTDMQEWIFGCDICQDVCPWNRFAKPSPVEAFLPLEGLQNGIPDFLKMEESEFERRFSSSPLDRPGLKGLQRNQKVSRPPQR